jgi:GntR family transcriptional regulator/MocR family aminotransferase
MKGLPSDLPAGLAGDRKPAAIYKLIKDAILSGQVRAAVRLPSERDYAKILGVSRGSVNTAYTRLRDEGFVTCRPGDGTYVSSVITAPKRRQGPAAGVTRRLSTQGRDFNGAVSHWWNPTRATAPFRLGRPALENFPFQTWHGYLRDMPLPIARALADYQGPYGYPRLRQSLSETVFLSRGINCSADDLIVTSGAQQGLSILFKVLCDPGDRVAFEDPGYPGSIAGIRSAGLEGVPVRVDRHGLCVEDLEAHRDIRAVIVSPTHQFPLGYQLSLERRLALLQWAQRNDAWIVEDDYDGELQYRYNAIPSLKSLDRNARVIYVGSFSKTLFPSIRLGFLIGFPEMMRALAYAKALADRFTGLETQWCLARFIESGEYMRHLKRMRELYRSRRGTFVEHALPLFGAEAFEGVAEAGIHICIRLPCDVDDRAICAAADRAGIDIVPLSAYCWTADERGLLFGFSGFSTEQCAVAMARLVPVLAAFGLGPQPGV